ncbi:MAG: rod shape-determining protein MreD [Acidimicrobiales bacterium]
MRSGRLSLLRGTPVVLVALVAQIAFVADLRVAGAVGDLMLVVTVAAALTGGPDRGATYGFGAGLAFDLVLDSPFGLSPLTYAIVGYAVGLACTGFFRPSGWWPVAVAALAAPVATVVYTAVAHLIGTPYPWGDLPAIALAVGLWNAALIVPAMAVMRWVRGPTSPDRLEVLLR